MASADWLEQLRHILDADLQLRTYKAAEWQQLETLPEEDPDLFRLLPDGAVAVQGAGELLRAEVLEIRRARPLGKTELRLVGLMLGTVKANRASVGASAGMEKQTASLGAWIMEQLDRPQADMLPEALTMSGRLYAEMIPFLLIREYHGLADEPYAELDKLLRSFFEEEIILLPLQRNEWLILSPTAPLSDTLLESGEEEESEEESLRSIGLGLHEMLASEWLGECHIAIALPIQPSKSIVETTALLRETVQLGRRFQIGASVHLPWELHLERLISAIPEGDRARFVEQAFSRSDYYVEPEIMTTLETFFSLDCNVSETAKKLYIHRNTLLYRLDKLKQETGLDVRLFRDAVMVKVILLLYKVTKRP
ncbi:PucR family transcriptional regulator [Paenibacillus albicereus]|uniref:PucR family transcriptional regulator n=1 Tax=Paenibacillus albicereus TaxID=2726185 RepID=A0A6H2GSJ3_9BACL|nr:helix-turn-helix domain-containing protein [Paenibacillus albicereus]QJC50365.1 PucR family transcriptional regulator [Paenibacillus albicereus]